VCQAVKSPVSTRSSEIRVPCVHTAYARRVRLSASRAAAKVTDPSLAASDCGHSPINCP
jgi:hypothetical protein